MELVELIRRHARRRVPAARLAERARAADGTWQTVEGRLQGEVLSSPRRARRLVRAFREVAAAHGAREAVGRAARLAGSYEAYLGRHDAALPLYEEASGALAGAARDAARLGSASSLLRLGRFDDAIATCRNVRRAARRRGDALVGAGADLNEAVARHEGGDPAAALPLYERAESVFREESFENLVATALQNRANALVLLDRYGDARPLYAEAQALFDRLGVTNEAARCLYNVGALLAATDRLGEADARLREAETALAAAGDDRQAALARLDRADVLLRAGLLEEAASLARGARRAMGRGVPPVERMRARLIEARARLLAGRGRSVRALLRGPAPRGMARAEAERREILARADALAGRHGKAAARLRDAARRHRRAGHPVGAARALCAAAWSARLDGDPGGARRDLARAATDLGDLDLPSAVHAREAVAFLVATDAGDRSAADAALARALDALERVRDGLGADAFRAAALRGREAWFARAVRHVLEGPSGASGALALLERWRARALRDLLAGAARVVLGGAGLDELRAEVARLERTLEGDAVSSSLRVREVAAPRAARELAAAESRLRAALRVEVAGTAPERDLDALRSALPRGTLVVSLFADDEGALLFAVDRDGVRLVRTPTTVSDVAREVERLRFRLGQFELGEAFVGRHGARLSRQIDDALARLGEATFAPLAAEVARSDRLIVVPHGPWHHAPLAALRLDGEPLVSRVDVALTPALGALETGLRRARGAPLVLAVADAAAPSIEREGREVARVLGAELRTGDEATLDALLARRSPACLHVAAHGRYRSDVPALSGVRLSDGWLRAAELPRLTLRGSTVVLSGCETGLSTVAAGDEVQGLVRGVFASGAGELVASLWRVDDPATGRLMTRLHRERTDGAATPAALCSAQRALHADGLPPWYWAGFQAWTRRLR